MMGCSTTTPILNRPSGDVSAQPLTSSEIFTFSTTAEVTEVKDRGVSAQRRKSSANSTSARCQMGVGAINERGALH
ncbi:hypothetical protein K1719_045174 [Acacia pycnantha]|nr:hypothetical protein K1719_045174 [Acacia pycnantha]